MPNRLITDIPSDIVSDGLQLYTDDIAYFSGFINPYTLTVRLPNNKEVRKCDLQYSIFSEEEKYLITIQAQLKEFNIIKQVQFNEKVIADKLNETIASEYDLNINDIDIIKDTCITLKNDTVQELLRKGILCENESFAINNLGLIYSDNQCIGTTEGLLVDSEKTWTLLNCVKIAHLECDRICFSNVNGWDVNIVGIDSVEEKFSANNTVDILLRKCDEIYTEDTKRPDFQYTKFDTSDADKLIEDRVKYFTISDNTNEVEFDIDF